MKEAAWAVSNVTAGNKEQIQAVINADIIKHLISVIIKVRINEYTVCAIRYFQPRCFDSIVKSF